MEMTNLIQTITIEQLLKLYQKQAFFFCWSFNKIHFYQTLGPFMYSIHQMFNHAATVISGKKKTPVSFIHQSLAYCHATFSGTTLPIVV